jgi:hypothetical protein
MSYSLKMITSVYGMISGFRREVAENCILLGYYAGSSGNFLPTRNCHYSLRNNPEERSSLATAIMSDIKLNLIVIQTMNIQNPKFDKLSLLN